MKYKEETIGNCITRTWLEDVAADGPFIVKSQFSDAEFNGLDYDQAMEVAQLHRLKTDVFRPDPSIVEIVYGRIDGFYRIIEAKIDSSD